MSTGWGKSLSWFQHKDKSIHMDIRESQDKSQYQQILAPSASTYRAAF